MQTATASAIGAYWQWRNNSIYYVKAGEPQPDRPPLLLVHGFGASTDHWRKNVTGLSSDFEVWAIDLLGFGRSDKPPQGYSGELWRDQLHDFITQVMGRPAVLAGNSIGGYMSLYTAADFPDQAAGLVLLNGAGGFTPATPPAEPDPIRGTALGLVRSLLMQPIPNFFIFQYCRQRSFIRNVLSRVYLNPQAVTDQLVEDIYRPTCDPGAAQAFNAMVFRFPPGEKIDILLQRLQCPLLMLWGEGDPWVKARTLGAKYREYYPTLVEHYLQAGHCPHDEVPDQVNGLMRSWVWETVVPHRSSR